MEHRVFFVRNGHGAGKEADHLRARRLPLLWVIHLLLVPWRSSRPALTRTMPSGEDTGCAYMGIADRSATWAAHLRDSPLPVFLCFCYYIGRGRARMLLLLVLVVVNPGRVLPDMRSSFNWLCLWPSQAAPPAGLGCDHVAVARRSYLQEYYMKKVLHEEEEHMAVNF